MSWEKSSDSYNWNSITNASGNVLSSSQIGTINSPTYFRGIIKSGSCPSVISNTSVVNIDSLSFGGLTSVNQSLCIGTLPSNVSVSKYRGSLQWQISSDNVNFVDVANAKSNILSPGSLTTTKYYRTSAINGVCTKVFSNSIQVLVSPKSTVGSLSSNQTICSGKTPNSINLSAATGNITWQYSSNNSLWLPISNASNLTLSGVEIGSISSQKNFRAVVKSGACSSVNSNIITISTYSNPIINAGLDQSVCPNTYVTLNATGAKSYVWSNGITNNIAFIPINTNTYTVTGTDINGCTGTSSVSVVVYSAPTVQISRNTTNIICQGTTFNLTSSTNSVISYQWKLNGSNISGEFSSTLTTKMEGNFSLDVQNFHGCPASSNILNIKLSPKPTISTSHSHTICLGDNVQLQAYDASNYVWNTGNQNGDIVYPTNSTKYIVSTTDTVSGCTNSDTMFVKVNSPSSSTINTTSLGTYNLNNISYDKSGQYVQMLKNVAGCDSTIILNLIVESLGLTDLESGNLVIYPNPSPDGKYSIKSDYEIDEIRIMNCEGKILKTIKKQIEIDISGFGRGVYFVVVERDKINNIFKLVY